MLNRIGNSLLLFVDPRLCSSCILIEYRYVCVDIEFRSLGVIEKTSTVREQTETRWQTHSFRNALFARLTKSSASRFRRPTTAIIV